MKEEISAWRKEMCFDLIVKPADDPLKAAIQFEPEDSDIVLPRELDRHLMVLTNYYSFLQSQLGTISARSLYLEEQLNMRVSLRSHKFGAAHASERKAMAISKDEDLKKLDAELSKEKAKNNMLMPIVYGIKNKIDSIKKMYDRKIREKNVA